MSLFSAVTALCEAVAAWFRYKTETDLDDRIESIHELLEKYEADIDALRTAGDPVSQQRADLLRSNATERRRFLKHLLARHSQAPTRDSGPDS